MNLDKPARPLAVPVLAYHQIEPLRGGPPARAGLVVGSASFRRQLLLLRALGYRAISLADLASGLAGERALPPRAVALTFDDGYHGVYDHGFAIARRHGFAGTLFLIAEDFAPERPAPVARAFPVLTAAQVREMAGAGWEIGSHSVSHPRLTDLPPARAREEIERSKALLERAFGRPVAAFCYPYGAHQPDLELALAAAGYRCATTTRFGRQQRHGQRYALRRIPVGADQGLAAFAYRLRWASEQ